MEIIHTLCVFSFSIFWRNLVFADLPFGKKNMVGLAQITGNRTHNVSETFVVYTSRKSYPTNKESGFGVQLHYFGETLAIATLNFKG